MAINISARPMEEADHTTRDRHLNLLTLTVKVSHFRKPLRGAKVKATKGSFVRTAITDADGIATIQLPAMKYDIEVSYNKAVVKTIKNFELKTGNTHLDIDTGLNMAAFGKIGAITFGLLFIGGLLTARSRK